MLIRFRPNNAALGESHGTRRRPQRLFPGSETGGGNRDKILYTVRERKEERRERAVVHVGLSSIERR